MKLVRHCLLKLEEKRQTVRMPVGSEILELVVRGVEVVLVVLVDQTAPLTDVDVLIVEENVPIHDRVAYLGTFWHGYGPRYVFEVIH